MKTITRSVSANKASRKSPVIQPHLVESKPISDERERTLRVTQASQQLALEFLAAVPELGPCGLGMLRSALDVVQAPYSCGVAAPFETLIADLLQLQSDTEGPSVERVECFFEEFRANFKVYLATAQAALRRYPGLVQGGGQ